MGRWKGNTQRNLGPAWPPRRRCSCRLAARRSEIRKTLTGRTRTSTRTRRQDVAMPVSYPISLRSESANFKANFLHAYSEIGMRRASTWTKSQPVWCSRGLHFLFYVSINILWLWYQPRWRPIWQSPSWVSIETIHGPHRAKTTRTRRFIEQYIRRSGNRERETDNQPTVQVQCKVSS